MLDYYGPNDDSDSDSGDSSDSGDNSNDCIDTMYNLDDYAQEEWPTQMTRTK